MKLNLKPIFVCNKGDGNLKPDKKLKCKISLIVKINLHIKSVGRSLKERKNILQILSLRAPEFFLYTGLHVFFPHYVRF